MRLIPNRLGITTKLLLWCLALVAIFYATTTFLLVRIQSMVESSRDLAEVHYDAGVATQRMVQQLQDLEHNIKRYEILQQDIYMEHVLADLARFGATLDETLERHPEYRDEWEPLTREYTITLSRDADPERILDTDETVAQWISILRKTREENREQMEGVITELGEQSRGAAGMGLVGLMACIVAGIGGSGFIAFRLNRSLSEIRQGIRRYGSGHRTRPVRVKSHDELGQLAKAFNEMTDRLEREERMRSDFISMLSHEIRTPLTSIRESVDMVAEGVFGDPGPEQKKFLDIAGQECRRLSTLLESMMTVSRLEAGALPMNPVSLNAAQVAREARERIMPVAQARDITINVELSNERLMVTADPERIRQVLLNLLGNAIKFSPIGENVLIQIADTSKGFATFSVHDHGPGIPPDEQALIFQKYYRQPSSDVDGAGLGLAISQGIVQAHGGEMSLESVPGQGSVFSFSLPVSLKAH